MKNLAFSLGFLFLLAACSPKNTTIATQYVKPTPTPVEIPADTHVDRPAIQKITLDGGQSQLDFKPQVDILFVEDNSDSMKNKQDNLFRSIDQFVAGLQNNRMIDYHIGVVSVWDSSDRFQEAQTFGIGELRFVKDAQGHTLQSRFVTRANNKDGLLAASLKLGVMPYDKGGPENEELFSPLSAAIEKSGHGGVNEGFFRPDAQLVVVLMTDADDSTAQISPDQMARELIEFKGGDDTKVSVYAALVSKSDSDDQKDWALRIDPNYHKECFDFIERKDSKGRVTVTPKNNGHCTQGFGPDRLEEFVVVGNGGRGTPDQIRKSHILSITQKDFGKDLAKIGDDITMHTLEKVIYLNQMPNRDDNGNLQIWVRYGTPEELAKGQGQLIPQKEKGGWMYDASITAIRLSGDVRYNYQEGARFSVEMIPVNLRATGSDQP